MFYKFYLTIAFLFCLWFFIAPPVHAAPFMSSGLVGYWKFDEGK